MIAKLNHIDSSSGKLIFSNFKFQNNILETLSKFPFTEISRLESIRYYRENFINFFFQKDFKIAIINPLQTSQYVKQILEILKMIDYILLILLKLYYLKNIDMLLKKYFVSREYY